METSINAGSITEDMFTDQLKLLTIKDYVTPDMYGVTLVYDEDETTVLYKEATAALQACLASGKPIFIPRGITYATSSTLVAAAGLFGQAEGSRLLYIGSDTDDYLVTVTNHGVNVRDIILDCNLSCNGFCVSPTSARRHEYANVQVRFAKDCHFLTENGTGVTLYNCVAHGKVNDAGANHGIGFRITSTDNKMINCTADTCCYGLSLEGSGMQMKNCKFFCNDVGVHLADTQDSSGEDIQLNHCILDFQTEENKYHGVVMKNVHGSILNILSDGNGADYAANYVNLNDPENVNEGYFEGIPYSSVVMKGGCYGNTIAIQAMSRLTMHHGCSIERSVLYTAGVNAGNVVSINGSYSIANVDGYPRAVNTPADPVTHLNRIYVKGSSLLEQVGKKISYTETVTEGNNITLNSNGCTLTGPAYWLFRVDASLFDKAFVLVVPVQKIPGNATVRYGYRLGEQAAVRGSVNYFNSYTAISGENLRIALPKGQIVSQPETLYIGIYINSYNCDAQLYYPKIYQLF